MKKPVTFRMDSKVHASFKELCRKSNLSQAELLTETLRRHAKVTASAMLVERHHKLRSH